MGGDRWTVHCRRCDRPICELVELDDGHRMITLRWRGQRAHRMIPVEVDRSANVARLTCSCGAKMRVEPVGYFWNDDPFFAGAELPMEHTGYYVKPSRPVVPSR